MSNYFSVCSPGQNVIMNNFYSGCNKLHIVNFIISLWSNHILKKSIILALNVKMRVLCHKVSVVYWIMTWVCCYTPTLNRSSEVWKRLIEDHCLCMYFKSFVFRAGRGLVHVGIMLWSAEWGDGYRSRERAAARVWGRCGTVSFRPHCRILHIPAHQLHQHQSGVSGLWTSLLCL